MMDCHKVCTAWESALDHQLSKRRDDRWKNVTSAKHGLANGHEVGDGMIAIADELPSGSAIAGFPEPRTYFLQVAGYQSLVFGV